MHGETTFQILEKGKMKSVSVNRTEYCLTDEAIKEFKDIHDNWELDVCEKNPYDPLLGGNYISPMLQAMNGNPKYCSSVGSALNIACFQ